MHSNDHDTQFHLQSKTHQFISIKKITLKQYELHHLHFLVIFPFVFFFCLPNDNFSMSWTRYCCIQRRDTSQTRKSIKNYKKIKWKPLIDWWMLSVSSNRMLSIYFAHTKQIVLKENCVQRFFHWFVEATTPNFLIKLLGSHFISFTCVISWN